MPYAKPMMSRLDAEIEHACCNSSGSGSCGNPPPPEPEPKPDPVFCEGVLAFVTCKFA